MPLRVGHENQSIDTLDWKVPGMTSFERVSGIIYEKPQKWQSRGTGLFGEIARHFLLLLCKSKNDLSFS